MLKNAARPLFAAGLVLLIFAVAARFGSLTPANRVGDDLAIAASALLVVITGLYVRFGR